MTGKVDKWQFQLVLGTLMTIVAAILSFLTYMMFRLDDKVDIVQESQHQVAREVSEISGVLNTIDFINLK